MALTGSVSFMVAAVSTVLVFSGMQMYKPWLTSSQLHTLLGGYLGSLLFVFSLTAVGNLESCLFGKSYQVKIFPEVIFCLLIALLTAATIHRVCATTCVLISLCSLYYINRYSQRVLVVQPPVVVAQTGKKKK